MEETKRSPWPTCFSASAAFAAMLAVLALAGCQHSAPRLVQSVVERRIVIRETLLKCLPEPVAKEAWRLSSEAALFISRLAGAGQDCRLKFDAAKRLIEAQ